MFSADLMLLGSVFHRVGVETEKTRIPVFVLSLGRGSKFDLHDRNRLCCLAGASVESKYEGCLDERAGKRIVQILNVMRNSTGRQ